jgi:DMSO/TMAO reductase YedYZ molybdopterin-dependent catalytic subunit
VDAQGISRRELLLTGSIALAAVAFLRLDRLASAAPLQPGEEVLTWLDQRAELPPPARDVIGQQLVWEELDAWITPNDKFFTIKHLGQPSVDIPAWRLDIGGLVKHPASLTLDELKARPRQEVTFTIECSGNHGFPFNGGLVGNANWAGTPLGALLDEAGIQATGRRSSFTRTTSASRRSAILS